MEIIILIILAAIALLVGIVMGFQMGQRRAASAILSETEQSGGIEESEEARRLEESQEKLKGLEVKIKSLGEELAARDQKISSLESQNKALGDECNRMTLSQGPGDTLKGEIEQLKEENLNTSRMLEESRVINAELKSSNEELSRKIEQSATGVSHDEFQEKVKALESLERHYMETRTHLEQARKENWELQEKIKELDASAAEGALPAQEQKSEGQVKGALKLEVEKKPKKSGRRG
jgi:hypothetical protein